MKMAKGFRVIFGLGLAISNMALLGDDHGHDKGPHGGLVKSFGSEYHIEGVRAGAKVVLYVLDSNGEKAAQIPKTDGGDIRVIAPGVAPQKSEIKAGEPFSEATVVVPEKGNVTVLVNLKMADKPNSAKFSFSN